MSSSNTDTGDTTTIIATSRNKAASATNGMDPLAATAAAGEPLAFVDVTTSALGGEMPTPREALITTAVNFLQNAKVRHTTIMQKQQFLRSKGLTEEEIQLACERAGVFTHDPNSPTVINMGIRSSQTLSPHAQLTVQPRQSAFGRIKELLHSVALLSGVAYGIYLFWRNYLVPFLFGKRNEKKPIDEAIDDIDKKVETQLGVVNSELAQIKDTLQQQQRDQKQQLNREFGIFKSDLEAIKGLLLNRKQFSTPLNAGPPSIPAWQMSASPHHLHRHRHSQSDDNEKADDAGSGSGSSETEVVTKNSDSSLEIM